MSAILERGSISELARSASRGDKPNLTHINELPNMGTKQSGGGSSSSRPRWNYTAYRASTNRSGSPIMTGWVSLTKIAVRGHLVRVVAPPEHRGFMLDLGLWAARHPVVVRLAGVPHFPWHQRWRGAGSGTAGRSSSGMKNGLPRGGGGQRILEFGSAAQISLPV